MTTADDYCYEITSRQTETLPNGNVLLTETDSDGATLNREFCSMGSYVYRVLPSGALSQVCKHLRPTGPTLMTVPGKSLRRLIADQFN